MVYMEIEKIFAKNIQLYRGRLGLTQEELAERCFQIEDDALANRSYISDIENCRRNITLDKIGNLAKALGVQPHQLFLTKDDSEKL